MVLIRLALIAKCCNAMLARVSAFKELVSDLYSCSE